MGGLGFRIGIDKKEYLVWIKSNMYMAFGSKCNKQQILVFKLLHIGPNNEGNEVDITLDEQDD
jgi:hypothetical protein